MKKENEFHLKHVQFRTISTPRTHFLEQALYLRHSNILNNENPTCLDTFQKSGLGQTLQQWQEQTWCDKTCLQSLAPCITDILQISLPSLYLILFEFWSLIFLVNLSTFTPYCQQCVSNKELTKNSFLELAIAKPSTTTYFASNQVDWLKNFAHITVGLLVCAHV